MKVHGEIDWDGNTLNRDTQSIGSNAAATAIHDACDFRNLLVYFRIESLPSLFNFISLLGGERPLSRVHPTKDHDSMLPLIEKQPLRVHGLRILKLTERLSSVMKESEMETKDLIVNCFSSFGQLNNLSMSGDVKIVLEDSYADTIAQSASEQCTDMIPLPWSESGSVSETTNTTVERSRQRMLENGPHTSFIASI